MAALAREDKALHVVRLPLKQLCRMLLQLTRDDFILDYVDDGATDADEDIEIGGRSSSGNRVRRRRRR